MEFLNILFGFNGRIGRAAYWLGTILKWVVLSALSALMQGSLPPGYATMSREARAAALPDSGAALTIALLIFVIYVSWGLAISVKRWHDRDKSGVWVFINLIPIVGPIWQLVECGFLPGTVGRNPYGGPAAVAETASVFS